LLGRCSGTRFRGEKRLLMNPVKLTRNVQRTREATDIPRRVARFYSRFRRDRGSWSSNKWILSINQNRDAHNAWGQPASDAGAWPIDNLSVRRRLAPKLSLSHR